MVHPSFKGTRSASRAAAPTFVRDPTGWGAVSAAAAADGGLRQFGQADRVIRRPVFFVPTLCRLLKLAVSRDVCLLVVLGACEQTRELVSLLVSETTQRPECPFILCLARRNLAS